MKIGIDANEANCQERVGVHQVALETIWGIYKNQINFKNDLEFVLYLRSKPKSFLPKETIWWKYKVLKSVPVWTLIRLTPHLLLNRDKVDVFYSPSHYLPIAPNVNLICTIHDLGYLKYSEQFRKRDFWQLKYWSAISISISKRIISVSQATKRDIVRHYPFASKRIEVIHNGYDGLKFNTTISVNVVRRVMEKYGIKRDYILFLSTLKPSKNIEGIIRAYSLLPKKQREEHQLVIAVKKVGCMTRYLSCRNS
jgi:glycosyltransferase involved in cell wall biosynthesis